ncbi:MAG: glutamate 5-kinase [Oscillospiraceae bacterium]|nr:glutamate 5-kinase [Oscillospiraceae bacterium]
MSLAQQSKRIVIKVGTSTITHENGKPNIRRIDLLCRVISDLGNSGREIIFVTSGAIGMGVGKLGLPERPVTIPQRQACAAIGQCELMFLYDKFFSEYGRNTAQVLLTGDIIENDKQRANVVECINALLAMNIIPVVNENDTVAIDELAGHNIGDNDNLSAIVAQMTGAGSLILLTDIDGLYDTDPRSNDDAVRLPVVLSIDDSIRALAGGTGSTRGTGGMITKLSAAERACAAGIDTYIASGENPACLYDIVEGKSAGTHFVAKRNKQ